MDNEEIAGVKFSEFPMAIPGDSDAVVGLHSGDNARFSIANIVLAVRQGIANLFVPQTRKVNNKALSSDIALTASDVGARADNWTPSASDVGAQPTITASGILKGDGAGGVSAATAGTDYATPAQLEGKANQSQLAYVETGTTASRNYTAGQYISLNGLLYTADTAIASGATFYTSGGNKNLTECVGGGFNFSSPVITTTDATGSGTIYIAPTPPTGYTTGVLIGFEASYQYNAFTLVGVYSLGYNYPFRIIVNSSVNQTVGAKILWFR